ncbi:MAG: hypothetical protein JRI91_06660 [Deltaproteobacteria bacterium]|nr:hypothetical protein [Deltaproteobacteria bacterium]
MECPKCGYERQPEDINCQLCGVDFGLLERQEEEKRTLKEKAKKHKGAEEHIHLSMEDKAPESEISSRSEISPGSEISTDTFMEEDCPKCGYERKKDNQECPNCGLIYAKHEDMVTRKEAEKAAKKIAEQKKFTEEKAKIQKELKKGVAKAQAKREEEARITKEAEVQEPIDESIKQKKALKDKVLEILQPIKQHKKKIAIVLIAIFAVAFAGWGGTVLFKNWQKHAGEERVRSEKNKEKQKLIEYNKKIAVAFRKDRAEIENYLRSLIDKRKFDAYKKEMDRYDIPLLKDELSDLKKYFKEIELFDKVKWVSGKEYEKNYGLYLELQKLNPDNKLYLKKIKYYQKKFADQKYLQAKNYFNKKKPYRSELKNALTAIEMAIDLNGAQKKYLKIKSRLINAELLFYEGNDKIKMAVRNDGLTSGRTGGQRKLYVWIKNTGSSPFYVNVEYFILVGRNNKKYKYNNCSRELLANLQPGEATQGYLYFYTSVKPKKLVFSHINVGTVSRVFP